MTSLATRRWPLDAHLPGFAKLPRLSLAQTPTRVERLRLPGYLESDKVWVKREDLISPIYGGNKVRRLELLLADAQARGAKRILTIGGLGSTQVQATALLGRAAGFQVTAVLFDQPMTDFARRALRVSGAAGCELIHGGSYAMTFARTLRALLRDRPYLIMPGAANPLANLGYLDAMVELSEQVERSELPRPDAIIVPAGSAGTLAAIALGCALLGWRTEVIGVRITLAIACNRLVVSHLIRQTARLVARLGGPAPKLRPRFRLIHDQVGRGYGYATPQASEGAMRVAEFSGAPGEITYTGKTLAALRALAKSTPEKNILYWHTLTSAQPPACDLSALPLPIQRALQLPNQVVA